MNKNGKGLSAVLVFALGLAIIAASAVLAAEERNAGPAKALLNLGTVGPDAVNLKVWTDQPEHKKLKPGDKVAVNFNADKDCYLVVLNVSSRGGVTVVFPNKEQKDNRIVGGKDYTIFGPGSRLRLVLGKRVPEAKLVFFVSPEPVDLDSFKIPDNEMVFRIPPGARDRLTAFREKLEQASQKKGFNRVLLSIKTDQNGEADLKLMGGKFKKGLPSKDSSEGPETITGTAGRKEGL